MNSAHGYVYLIGSYSLNWYKIGKSKTPGIRIKNIGILLPFKIEMVALWKCWSPSVEVHVHQKYANNHIHGEWFRFTRKELTKVVCDPLWNATLVMPSEFAEPSQLAKFRNMERDSPIGKKLSLKFVGEKPDPYVVVQHILIRKLKQALKNYPNED